VEILYSLRDNYETFVPAGNQLGKDFIAALGSLWFFCSRRPCRIVTTSVQAGQLEDVLWSEIRRLIHESKVALPIEYKHLHISHIRADGSKEELSSFVGRVVRKGEALLGRHLPLGPNGEPATLAVFDEASGIDDAAYHSTDSWAHRKLIIGNPFPCRNFFFHGVKGGDLRAPTNGHYTRKVIRIRAEDSPNIKLAKAQLRKRRKPTGEILIPGVVGWATYLQRRELWDKVRQCIGLDGEFYEGVEQLLFPPEWLNRSERLAEKRPRMEPKERSMGVDTGEGGDDTCWTVINPNRILHMQSQKTPDTNVIPGITIQLMRRYEVPADKVLFDRGGGGKEHVDALRAMGYPVNTIAFGEAATPPPKRGLTPFRGRVEGQETRTIYASRRVEMYDLASQTINPANGGFGIPASYTELRRQLAVFPRQYDREGKQILPPKRRVAGMAQATVTLDDMIGNSPDEADSFVLAIFALKRKVLRSKVRAF
jgi:hypothetical protein